MPTTLTIGELKARLPEALSRVRKGETVAIAYGRRRRPVAILAPPPTPVKRRLGHLAGKVRVTIAPDWAITDETLLKA